MEPLRLELQNFMAHKSTIIDYTLFQSALIVAKGSDNENISNGAGKSTLFKAIEYVLFNYYPTKTIDEIVNKKSEMAKVIFDFKINDSIYRIERSRNSKTNKSDLRLWEKKNNEWTKDGDLTSKTSTELEREIKKLIKINHNAFRNSVLFAQGDLLNLSSAKSPQDRKNILKDVLDLLIYSKFEKTAKEELSLINKNILNQKSLLASIGDPKIDLQKLEEEILLLDNSLYELLSSYKATELLVLKEASNLDEIKKSIHSDYELLKHKVILLQEKKCEISNTIEKLNKNISSKKYDIINFNLKLKNEKELIISLGLKKETISNDLLDTNELEKKISNISTKELDKKSKLLSLNVKLKELHTPLPDGEFCSHCRQQLSQAHLQSCKTEIEKDISICQTEITKLSFELEEIKIFKQNIEKQISNNISNKNEISNINSNIENKNILIKELQDNLKNNEINLQLVIQELEENSLILRNYNLEESVLLQKISLFNIENINNKISEITEKISQLELTKKQTNDKIISYNSKLGALKERMSVKSNDLKKYQQYKKDLEKIERQQTLYQLVSQSFSSGGIPTMIIYTILDDLQLEVSKFLSDLRPGLELQFLILKDKDDGSQEDTLDIVYKVNGVDFSYESLSGGQQFMIALCLRLGLSIVIQNRLGINIKFIELDEVDKELDKAGVESLALLIKKLQNEFKILMVTHNDDLKDKFSHAILVQYDQNAGSTAEVVTSW